MAPFTLCASPAKAGVQLGDLPSAGDTCNHFNLSNWAPACAGEVNNQ